jgi:DNA-binding LacI/PurR family transcriptional regulator
MATMKDVARAVGLSVTTVSRALGDHGDVAEETKNRIRDVAKRLDYHPNATARSLQNSKANAIGLVIPSRFHHAYDSFWLDFIGGMAAVCARRGIDLVLSAIQSPGELDDDFKRLIRSRRIDGIVICDVRRTDARIEYLKKHNLPFTAFGRTTGQDGFSYIDVDSAAGIVQAMEYLVGLGHRRIGFMDVDSAFSFSHFRLSGYREALYRAKLTYDPSLMSLDVGVNEAQSAASRLLSLPQPPTAIIAAADYLALAVLKVARARGLSVPQDLSLAAFDDNLTIQQAHPAITAISQPNRRLGEEAASLLLDRVSNPESPLVQRIIVPTLVTRESTCPPILEGPKMAVAH